MKPVELKRSHWIKYNFLFLLEHFLGYSRLEKYFGQRRKNLNAQIEQHLKNSNGNGTREVKNVNKEVSLEEFRKLCHDPVAFRGVGLEWPSTKKWSLDYFEEHYSDTEILLNDNTGLVDPNNRQEFDKLKLGEYISLLKNGSLSYLKFSRFVDENPELKEELDLSWLRKLRLPLSMREESYIFMGGVGTVTPLHVGVSCNLFIQVYGKRKWTMYAPGDRIYLDARTERFMDYYYSKADPNILDDPRFPLLKYAKKFEITLEPGDVLWIPPFTWHHVVNPTPSIGLSFRFTNLPACFKASKVLTSLIFMATRPNPITHLFATLFAKNNYIFSRAQALNSEDAKAKVVT